MLCECSVSRICECVQMHVGVHGCTNTHKQTHTHTHTHAYYPNHKEASLHLGQPFPEWLGPPRCEASLGSNDRLDLKSILQKPIAMYRGLTEVKSEKRSYKVNTHIEKITNLVKKNGILTKQGIQGTKTLNEIHVVECVVLHLLHFVFVLLDFQNTQQQRKSYEARVKELIPSMVASVNTTLQACTKGQCVVGEMRGIFHIGLCFHWHMVKLSSADHPTSTVMALLMSCHIGQSFYRLTILLHILSLH